MMTGKTCDPGIDSHAHGYWYYWCANTPVWCNGGTADFHSVGAGSIPVTGSMVVLTVHETVGKENVMPMIV